MSSRDGRGQPMSCWAVMMTLWSAFLSAAVELKGLFNDSMANIAILVPYQSCLCTTDWDQ